MLRVLQHRGAWRSSSCTFAMTTMVVRGANSTHRWCSSSSTSTAEASSSTPPPAKKIQIAVVGSGPSGCFVASYLTKRHPHIHVDVLERLPVPFGLCRYGVAPDHPDVRNVEKQFMELFTSGRVTWIGNINIGRDVPLPVLLQHYAAVVFATGAECSRKLGIEGEELHGVVAAKDFVNYYNTMPFPYGSPRFCPFDVESARRAVIIGNGNVAMDVARVLSAPYKFFCPTEMNCAALKAFVRKKMREVCVVGRRGVQHSAFTIAEFRELTTFQPEAVTVRVDNFDVEVALANAPPQTNPRAHQRLMNLVHQFARSAEEVAAERMQWACDAEGRPLHDASEVEKTGGAVVAPTKERTAATSTSSSSSSSSSSPTTVSFMYSYKPIRIVAHPRRRNVVGGVLLERTNTLKPGDVQHILMPCDTIITSIGHVAEPLAGLPQNPSTGALAHHHGRVVGAPRVYCAGWAKNGSKGVILHSVADAQETVATILHDIEQHIIPNEATMSSHDSNKNNNSNKNTKVEEVEGGITLLPPEHSSFTSNSTYNSNNNSTSSSSSSTGTTMTGKFGLLDYFVAKQLQPITLSGLARIHHVEKERGIDLGKRAERMESVRDMLDVALGGEVGKKTAERVRGITPARPDALLYLKELLDDDTNLAPLAHSLAKDLPRRLAEEHPPGRIAPTQL